ncbi:MAG: hypothetical protein MUC65_06515 [Pontiellaceae bacterium]|jgi:hypothetical protein|nr:hypothetical protein [Pontiellaceae bacterium]
MQYGDAFHCQNNVLVVSIHIYAVMGSDDVEINVDSVLEAKFCDPMELKKILKNPRKYFMRYEEVRSLKSDAAYILTIAANERCDYKIMSIEEVTPHVKEAWKRLH